MASLLKPGQRAAKRSPPRACKPCAGSLNHSMPGPSHPELGTLVLSQTLSVGGYLGLSCFKTEMQLQRLALETPQRAPQALKVKIGLPSDSLLLTPLTRAAATGARATDLAGTSVCCSLSSPNRSSFSSRYRSGSSARRLPWPEHLCPCKPQVETQPCKVAASGGVYGR